MWLWCLIVFATVLLDTAQSDAGLSSTSFSNELRSGFTRLFQNGVEQPLQQPQFVLVNPVAEFQNDNNPLLQRPAPISPLGATGYPQHTFRPRYNPPRSGAKRPNDVLVVVIKKNSNCTASTNGTNPNNGADPVDDDDDDDNDDGNEGPSPDDDVEEVTIVTGGTEKGKEPSRCVWAILSCCAPANTPIRYTCFDVLGCSTAFWDTNPCVPAILQSALDQATKYYVPATSTNRTMASTPPPAPSPAATDNVAVDLTTALLGGASTPIVASTPSAVDITTIATTAT